MINKLLFSAAFTLGALAIIWIGRLFLGVDALGLGVTVLIGAVYAIGTMELIQFRRSTDTLWRALANATAPIDNLQTWLQAVDPSLQNATRLRIEGERNGLPAPVLTPYLVGLLVMLGLLGTFVGMVDTLKGAVVALEGSSELEAIRAGLAAPIEGLGLAFGTSVAGVAASAMLGLLSTLSRRERLQTSQVLDTKADENFRQFSRNHQQKLAFQAMQDQANTLPLVVEQLTALAHNLEKMGEQLGEGLTANQEQFHGNMTDLYANLNKSVDQSLKTSLVESAELIGASIAPMTATTLTQLSDATLGMHERLAEISDQQFAALNQSIKSNSASLDQAVDASLRQQSESSGALAEVVRGTFANASSELQSSSKDLLKSFGETSEQWASQQHDQASQFSETIKRELSSLRNEESQRGDAAVERLSKLEGSVTEHLTTLGQALEAPMTRLIETASQTPKAAADVIEKLRGEMTKNLERDNDLLAERQSLMAQLDDLSTSLGKSASGQREAIDSLIERSAETLSQVGNQFGERLEGEASKLAGVVDHFASSSAEIASLGDAFNAAVMLFSDANNKLIENLSNIELALEHSNSRSDEQLAYYVSQAREIIDHNLLSHQQLISALQTQKPTQLAVT